MDKNIFDFVSLLYFDADPDTVDAWLNQHLLIFVARNGQRIEEDFERTSRFNLWHVMSF